MEDLSPCVCGRMRRTSRALTRLYDEALEPVGLTVTQFSVLRTLSRMDRPALADLAEAACSPEVGDRLVLFTDGVFTMRNRSGEEFGDRAFFDLVQREAPKNTAAFINFVERTLERYREGAQASSDFTVFTLLRARAEGASGPATT